jgi:hypothetical protein
LNADVQRVYPIWVPFCFAGTVLLFCHSTLLVWNIPLGLHFAAYFLLGMSSCITPMLFPWVHLIMKDDNEARSFTTGSMVSRSTPTSILLTKVLHTSR